jgi:hypothetical protein
VLLPRRDRTASRDALDADRREGRLERSLDIARSWSGCVWLTPAMNGPADTDSEAEKDRQRNYATEDVSVKSEMSYLTKSYAILFTL